MANSGVFPGLDVYSRPSNHSGSAGKRILITGANSGIGFQAALALARDGALIVLACRDRARGEAALAKLRGMLPDADAALGLLDLASLDSVREFAARELERGLPLHVLINNAGVMAPPRRLGTADGFELQFGTNVLGHFALTALLMPALQRARQQVPRSEGYSAAAAARVVTVASIAHRRGRIDFGDLQSRLNYSPMRSYAQSKLADLLFALEFDRRLRAAGSPLLSLAAHPGVAATNLFLAGDRPAPEKALRKLLGHAIGLFLNTEAQGALPIVHAAAAPAVAGGDYYGPTGFKEMRGSRVGHARLAPQAQDLEVAARLWQVCEALTGIAMPGLDG